MRLPVAFGLLITATALNAADEPYHIARWGNALLVTAPGGPGMSPAIAAKLNQRVTLDFQDAPLTDVVDFLRSVSHINIVVAPAVALSAPAITLKAKDMSLGNTLHWLTKLSNTHMGFIHGALFISDQPVQEASVTRMYDISDMTMAIRDFPGPEMALSAGGQNGAGGVLFKPVEDSGSTAPTTEEITDIIKLVIAQGSGATEVSALQILAYVGEACFWIWSLVDGIANTVVGLAGFQQDDDEGTTLPNWVGWTMFTLLLSALAVLVYALNR